MPPDSPDGADRRRHERVEFSARVKLKFPGVAALEQYFVQNLSRNGIFIQTPKPLKAGREIQLQVTDGEGEVLFEAIAKVMWARTESNEAGEPPGMGLKFTQVGDASRQTIERIVAQSPGVAPADVVEPSAPPPQKAEAPAPQQAPAASTPVRPPAKPSRATSQAARKPGGPSSGKGFRVPRSVWMIGAGVLALVAGTGLTVRLVGTHQKKTAYLEELAAQQQTLNEAMRSLDETRVALDERKKAAESRVPELRKRQLKLTTSRQEALRLPRKMRAYLRRRGVGFKLSSMARAAPERDGSLKETRFDLEMYGDVRRLTPLFKTLFRHGAAMEVQSLEVSLLSFNTTQCRVKARVAFFQVERPQPEQVPDGALPPKYASLVVEQPVPEQWQGLGGKAIRQNREKIDELRGGLSSRVEDAVAVARLEATEQSLSQWETLLDDLEQRSKDNQSALLELSDDLAKEAQTSSLGVARASVDGRGRLSMR